MTTGSLMAGRVAVGEMVKGGEPLIWKAIVSKPGLVLAVKMAWLKEPAPLRLVFITRMVLPQPVLPRLITSISHPHRPRPESWKKYFDTSERWCLTAQLQGFHCSR